MMRQAINAATPAINTTATEPLTDDQLHTLYSLR
jgi:integrase/recombinase XerD